MIYFISQSDHLRVFFKVKCILCIKIKIIFTLQGLERLVTKFQSLVRDQVQSDEFVSLFFNVANQLENERRTFALSRLRVSPFRSIHLV